MTQQLEYTNRLCIDGPFEGTFVKMHSNSPGAVVHFPVAASENKHMYQLLEDGSLQYVGMKK